MPRLDGWTLTPPRKASLRPWLCPPPGVMNAVHVFRCIRRGAWTNQALEAQPDRGATARRFADIDGGVVKRCDLAHERQANAAALPLRREERYENLVALRRHNSRTVVGNGDDDMTVEVAVCRNPNHPLMLMIECFDGI